MRNKFQTATHQQNKQNFRLDSSVRRRRQVHHALQSRPISHLSGTPTVVFPPNKLNERLSRSFFLLVVHRSPLPPPHTHNFFPPPLKGSLEVIAPLRARGNDSINICSIGFGRYMGIYSSIREDRVPSPFAYVDQPKAAQPLVGNV